MTTTTVPTTPARENIVAMLLYALIVGALLHRVFLGDVLRPGASVNYSVPFLTEQRSDPARYGNIRHVSDIHMDVWRMLACCEHYQFVSGQQGRFPTWNPHIYCGMPFHANAQSAMLNPFHVIYFWVDPDYARGPMAALRLWLAAMTTYLLARRLRVGMAGAFLSGVVWMLCGFNVRWLLWPLANSTLWMPILLLALDLLLEQPTCRHLALASLAAAALQLAGHPETQFQVGLAAGAYVLVRMLTLGGGARNLCTRFVLSLTAMLVGTALAAVALLPFLVRLPGSADWQMQLHQAPGFLPISAVDLLLAPDHLGRPRASHGYYGPDNYVEANCWFGVLPFVLSLLVLGCITGTLVVGAVRILTLRRNRQVGAKASHSRTLPIFAACLGLFAVCVCFDIGPVNAVLQHVPPLSQCNNLRFVFAIQFAGALLAGYGLNALIHRPPASLHWIATALMAGVTARIGWLVYDDHVGPLTKALQELDVETFWHHPSFRTAIGLVFALLATAVLGVWQFRRNGSKHAVPRAETDDVPVSGRSSRYAWWLCGIVTAELLWVAWDFNPLCPKEIANPPATPIMEQIFRESGHGRVVGIDDVLMPDLAMRYGFRDVRGYDYPVPVRIFKVMTRIGVDIEWTIIPSELVFPEMGDALAAFLDRASVRFLYSSVRHRYVTPRSSKDGHAEKWPLVSAQEPIDSIYSNPNAYERAWFARRATIADAEQALDALLDPALDLRLESVIETSDPAIKPPPIAAANSRVTMTRDDPEEIVLRTDAPTGGLLVLADHMENGWRVSIDGKPATPLQANYLFRGVVVPPGEHEVRWTYHCPGLRTGIVVSAVTLFIVLILLCIGSPRRRVA